MALLKKLTVTGTPTDGTTVTNANTNTTPTISSPSTMKFQSAKAMGAAYGIQLVQNTTYTTFFYFDLSSDVTGTFVILCPLRFEAAPTATDTLLRFYPTGNSGHTTNLGGFLLTTTRRLQFLENGTGGLNVTSDSGTPMVAATDYILAGKLNLAANTMEAKVFPRGSSTALFTISGNLAADMAAATGIQYLRFGIATASTALDLSTNDEFAVGDTDYLSRYDLVVPPTIDVDQTLADNLVDLRGSAAASGQTPLTFPNPAHVSGPTLTYQDLTGTGLWLFDQDPTTDAVYTMTVSQADAQTATQNVTIPHLPTANVNAPLVPSGSSPGTSWA